MAHDSEIGSLAVGTKADRAVFDFRRLHLYPAGALGHTGQGRDVAMVRMDGRCVVANGDVG
jgi:cytosine/adenosine deaminase-related metal-dependent hydrolase